MTSYGLLVGYECIDCVWVMVSYGLLGGYRCIGFRFDIIWPAGWIQMYWLCLGCDIWPAGWIQMYWLWVVKYGLLGGYICIGSVWVMTSQPAGWIQMYWLWVMTSHSLLGGYRCVGFGLWHHIACWVDTDVLALGCDIIWPAGWIQMYWLWVVTSYGLLGGYRCVGFGLWHHMACWVDTNILPLCHVEGRKWYRYSPPCNLRSCTWAQSHDANDLYLPVIAECQDCFQSDLIYGPRVGLGPFFVGLLWFSLTEPLHRCSIPTSLQPIWDFLCTNYRWNCLCW